MLISHTRRWRAVLAHSLKVEFLLVAWAHFSAVTARTAVSVADARGFIALLKFSAMCPW